MKKLFMPLMLCFSVLLGLCALAGCAQELNETGNWKLSYFGDGEGNYAVGDDYRGSEVTENLYSCSFDGASYKIYCKGAVVGEGGYSAERAGKNSVLLSLDGVQDCWNLGIQTQLNGKGSVGITAEFDGKVICFVPA